LDDGRPVVRGVWDGVGLAIPSPRSESSQVILAETELDLPQGAYTVEAALDIAPLEDPGSVADGHVSWQAENLSSEPLSLIALAHTSRIGGTLNLQGELAHPGGKVPLRLRLAIPAGTGQAHPGRLWASGLRVTHHDSQSETAEPETAVLH
jgi:hypothetical protein